MPGKGLLCLPGGFLEEENWAHGGARELSEEVDVKINPADLQPFWFASSFPRPNRVLLFGRLSSSLQLTKPFVPNEEVSERGLVFGPEGLDQIMAFPLHAEAIKKHFQEKGMKGSANFAVC